MAASTEPNAFTPLLGSIRQATEGDDLRGLGARRATGGQHPESGAAHGSISWTESFKNAMLSSYSGSERD
jgi:hypothetical protein